MLKHGISATSSKENLIVAEPLEKWEGSGVVAAPLVAGGPVIDQPADQAAPPATSIAVEPEPTPPGDVAGPGPEVDPWTDMLESWSTYLDAQLDSIKPYNQSEPSSEPTTALPTTTSQKPDSGTQLPHLSRSDYVRGNQQVPFVNWSEVLNSLQARCVTPNKVRQIRELVTHSEHAVLDRVRTYVEHQKLALEVTIREFTHAIADLKTTQRADFESFMDILRVQENNDMSSMETVLGENSLHLILIAVSYLLLLGFMMTIVVMLLKLFSNEKNKASDKVAAEIETVTRSVGTSAHGIELTDQATAV